jgi:superfamily I DNA/RNA helicase
MAQAWADQSLLDRVVTAVQRVRDRLGRATAALEAASVPYAVVDDNAVAAWVATIDPAAVRNTRDVDILLRRADLDAAEQALTAVGFIRRRVAGIEMFLDGPNSSARDAVHVLMAGEKVRPADAVPTPDVSDAVKPQDFRIIKLEMLVRMKLTSYRDKDKTHLRDMLELGLIDQTWTTRFPPDLAARLQLLIDTPEG